MEPNEKIDDSWHSEKTRIFHAIAELSLHNGDKAYNDDEASYV